MSKTLHVFLHILGVVLQVVNVSAIPAPYQMPVAAGISIIQGLLAAANHDSTPAAPVK